MYSFFFNDTATTEIYTLSLHDALPIYWYKAFIDGSSLIIQKKVSGVTTILASVPFKTATGHSCTIHLIRVGLPLTANAWASSGSEPSGWMLTASDSTFTSGYCGLRFLT